MRIMRNKRWLIVALLFVLGSNAVYGQLKDTLSADSIKIVEMEKALNEARLNEMNLRLEMETMKMATIIQDSVKRVQQRMRIDSLRNITPGAPVIVESDTLYYIYSKRGGVPALTRSQQFIKSIVSLCKRITFHPASLYL